MLSSGELYWLIPLAVAVVFVIHSAIRLERRSERDNEKDRK